MSRIIEDAAEKLARRALKLAKERDNEKIIKDVADILGATSSTTHEHFLTFIRVHRASDRANDYLERLEQADT